MRSGERPAVFRTWVVPSLEGLKVWWGLKEKKRTVSSDVAQP